MAKRVSELTPEQLATRRAQEAARRIRRNEAARAAGYSSLAQQHRVRRELREKFSADQYAEQTRAAAREAEATRGRAAIAEAMQWDVYRKYFPTIRSRTVKSALLFLSGLGSHKTADDPGVKYRGSDPNSTAGDDRDDFIQLATTAAEIRYNMLTEFDWRLWRDQYADVLG